MAARAAEAVVQVEMAEGGIEIVAPQQADHPAAEPDAFGIAGRPPQRLLRFGKFIDLLRLLGRLLAVRRGLIGWLGVGVLGQRRNCQWCGISPDMSVDRKSFCLINCWNSRRTQSLEEMMPNYAPVGWPLMPPFLLSFATLHAPRIC